MAIVGWLLVGCGGGDSTRSSGGMGAEEPVARAAAVRAITPAVARFCERAARRASGAVVRCPAVLPANGGGFEVPRSYGNGRCQWLANLEPRGAQRREAVFHVLFGGSCAAWDLAVGPGSTWPKERPAADVLRLVAPREQGLERPRVLRRLVIAGGPALLVRVAPYPAGGIHGGHLGVVFNVGGDGYLVTGHAAAATPDGPTPATPAVVDALVAVATSMARARATGAA